MISDVSSFTGPSKPDFGSSESLVNGSYELQVNCSAAGNAASPIMRFGQRSATRISSLFWPLFNAPVTFARNGGFHRMPRSWPLSLTRAITCTSPRSSQISDFRPRFPDAGFQSNVFVYVAVPEKYFTRSEEHTSE